MGKEEFGVTKWRVGKQNRKEDLCWVLGFSVDVGFFCLLVCFVKSFTSVCVRARCGQRLF